MSEIKLSGTSIEETAEMIPRDTILLGYMGSTSHGTYVPSDDPDSIDDIDMMGVCVLPQNQYYGLGRKPELIGANSKMNNEQQIIKEGKWDIVVYELRKYFKLLLKQNPNVLGLLWLPENLYIHVSHVGRLLIDSRDIFTSKEAYHSFAGYASGQLHRMTHAAFEGYMGTKRKALVEKFGYDVKNAAHMIRLLNMGIEYLTDGVLRVQRSDASTLKQIKKGEWSLEKVKEESNKLFALAKEAYVKSPLPIAPDYDKAEKLIITITKAMHGRVG